MWNRDGGTRDEGEVEQLDKTMELKTLVEGEEETQDGGEASGVGREPDVEEWVLEGG